MATYEIVIKSEVESGDGGYESVFATSNDLQTQGKVGGSGSTLSCAKNTFSSLKAFAPVAAGISVTKQMFDWQASLVGRNIGSQQVQERINSSMRIATQVGMVGAAALTGNPFIITAAVASIAISYGKEVEQSYYERKWENISLVEARRRGGASLNRSRL